MGQLVLECSFEKNTILFSAQDIKESDFYGIAVNAPNYTEMTDDVIERYVVMATNYFENELGIKILKQVVTETLDYDVDSFRSYGFLRVTNPIGEVLRVRGGLNTQKNEVPAQWVVTKTVDRVENRLRTIHFVPLQGSFTYIFSGLYLAPFYHSNKVPNFWEVTYCVGYDVVPEYLMYCIKILATIPLFNIFGDIVLGAGLASFSLSLDGLSQSLATTNSSTNAGFGARVLNYTKELKTAIDHLIGVYRGINITVS